MNLQKLEDRELVLKTENHVKEGREILVSILYCFKEIERRRLFSDYGYSSLFDMAKKHFGYSDDEAFRRVSAMKLLKDVPEAESKITSGELSLSSISMAQVLFRQEEFSKEKKLEILKEMENKPTREAKRITLKYSSEITLTKPDYIKDISENKIEVFFTANEGLRMQLEDLKQIYPGLSIGEIIQVVCELRLKPAMSKKRQIKDSKAQIKRDVFENAQDKCELCDSKYHLEIDHIIPQAKGGSSHPANLRLLCRSCNQRSAIKEFGAEKMQKYLT